MEPQQKLGKDLKVGDTIRIWWSSFKGQTENKDTITRIQKYDGPLKHLWPDGAKLVWFRFNSIVGMTVSNSDYFEMVSTSDI